MVHWTEASNLHGVPTDCPQRDERMGWLNDLAARSEEAICNFDMARLFAKWVQDIADAQDPHTGAIADTAPFRWGRRPADPVSVCYLQIPWLLYIHYGDMRTLARHYGGMKAWVEFLRGCAPDDIVPYSYYGDWAPPVHLGVTGSQGSSAVSKDTPGELISTACYVFCLDLLSRIARVLNYHLDAQEYAALAAQVRSAYQERFWHEAAGGYGTNNQSCNAISLYMGLVPPERIARVVANLVRDVVEINHCHLTTGNICTKYLLEALTAHGCGDVAFAIASQETYPSWGYMLANGATTLWERWEHATGSGMNSHNHPMLGSVGSWLYRAIGGIQADPSGPGFSAFAVKPHIDRRLKSAATAIQTLRGEVASSWRVHDGRLSLTVHVPVGSEARVFVPAAAQKPLHEAGVVVWDEEHATGAGDIRQITRCGELLICTVGAGEYQFESALPGEGVL
jgi:alpha-L-rhamnosidase